jgi:hypothetical protein
MVINKKVIETKKKSLSREGRFGTIVPPEIIQPDNNPVSPNNSHMKSRDSTFILNLAKVEETPS